MRSTRKILIAIIAIVALVSAACGSDDLSTDTATTTTTAAPTTEPPAPSDTTAPDGHTVTVYFSTGDGSDCSEVSPFTRTSEHEAPEFEAAILELIAGPTDEEIAAGAGSFFSRETATSLALVDQNAPAIAVLGFGDLQALIPNASSSCGSEALLAQLNATALQYVPRVRYEMLGSCQLFANWLQRDCMEYTIDGAVPANLTLEQRAEGSGCAEPIYGLDDGQWFGYVTSATDAELEFDLACWFVAEAAIDAATEDGEESPPPNDYYVRNSDGLMATVAVASTTTVSWLPDIGDPSTQTAVPFSEWVEQREGRSIQPGVWLTVRDGQVTEIAEQYVP